MSGELEWLLTLAAPGSRSKPPAGLDAGRLADLAIAHGLTLRLVPFLENLPAETSYRLRRAARLATIADLRHRATLAAILRAFAGAAIPVVPFKGPVLADQLYPEGSARVSNDLDLLVRPEDVTSAGALLRRLDYHPQVSVANPPASPVLKLGGEMLFRSHSTRTPVDLHWKLFGWSAPCPARLADPWHCLEPGTWQGQPIPRLPATGLAAYLCYHGSKHLWLQLKYLFDLARLLESGPPVDWTALLDEALRRRESRFLLLGPWLAQRLLRAPVPALLLAQCERDSSLQDIANFVIAALESPGDWERNMRSRYIRARLLQAPKAVARHFFLEVFGPSVADWQSIHLPEALSPIYYPYRPLRLAGVRLSALWQG